VLSGMAKLQRNEAIDGAWVEDNFSYKIIPKSTLNLLFLEFMWKHVEHKNKIRILDPFSFFPNL
jgi:hypothetical protein